VLRWLRLVPPSRNETPTCVYQLELASRRVASNERNGCRRRNVEVAREGIAVYSPDVPSAFY